ncbi:hypothetical protein [Tannerella forsythia]|uniref:hypothetical protein n=1 Tax=Tannerella forsythia TaxID=28112 RepID=UPI0015CF4080|nr:hypothetical protein [Tannerella forsythia]
MDAKINYELRGTNANTSLYMHRRDAMNCVSTIRGRIGCYGGRTLHGKQINYSTPAGHNH